MFCTTGSFAEHERGCRSGMEVNTMVREDAPTNFEGTYI
jgi:hypothetical protein